MRILPGNLATFEQNNFFHNLNWDRAQIPRNVIMFWIYFRIPNIFRNTCNKFFFLGQLKFYRTITNFQKLSSIHFSIKFGTQLPPINILKYIRIIDINSKYLEKNFLFLALRKFIGVKKMYIFFVDDASNRLKGRKKNMNLEHLSKNIFHKNKIFGYKNKIIS